MQETQVCMFEWTNLWLVIVIVVASRHACIDMLLDWGMLVASGAWSKQRRVFFEKDIKGLLRKVLEVSVEWVFYWSGISASCRLC